MSKSVPEVKQFREYYAGKRRGINAYESKF